MLSGVLRSPRAVLVNIEIVRVFVRLRELLQSNAVLARRLGELERKSDRRFGAGQRPPVISSTILKNARLRADEMPQFTGTLW
jgi:hypothetical protein